MKIPVSKPVRKGYPHSASSVDPDLVDLVDLVYPANPADHGDRGDHVDFHLLCPFLWPHLSWGVPCSWGCMGEEMCSRIPFGQGEQAQTEVRFWWINRCRPCRRGSRVPSRQAWDVEAGWSTKCCTWLGWSQKLAALKMMFLLDVGFCWPVEIVKLSNLSRDIIPAEALFLKHCFPLFLLLGTADIKKMLRMSSASRFSDACSNKDA